MRQDATGAEQSSADAIMSVLDALDEGVVGVDLLGRVSAINREAARLTGVERRGAIGSAVGDTVRLFDESTGDPLVLEGASPTAERRAIVLGADGNRSLVAQRRLQVRNDRGEVAGLVLRLRALDATPVHDEPWMSEPSEARFRSLLEAAPDAIVIVDPSGRIVLVNACTETLFGRPRGQLLGASVESLVPQRFRERHTAHHQAFFAQALQRPTPALELCGLRLDDTEFPLEMTLSPLTTEVGPLVILAMRDISDRRHAEAQRARLAAIVDSSDDAIVGKTLEGIVTSWNAGAVRIFGYAPEEIVGRSIMLLIPPGREQEEASILERLGRGERIAHFRTVRLRKDGRQIHVAITSSAVRDARGVLIGASKVARDITDQVRAEEDLAHAKDAAEAANRELEAFSYSVAHDLRAPLRGMSGFARVLLEGYRDKLDAEGQDWLQEIVLNAQKMAALIDALLSLARLTRSEPRYARVDLSALAREAADQLAAADVGRDVEWVIEPGMVATLDPSLARALVGNLLGNAWKFTSKVSASRRACIEAGTIEIEGRRVFFVRDNGAGFDMAFADKLFGPFQRLHTVDEFPGTGIGLATVQRIVRCHGGRVWAEGRVDGGATFYFAFNEVVSGSPQ